MGDFKVFYSVPGDKKDAFGKAKDICLEQTAEMPEIELKKLKLERVNGKVESFKPFGKGRFLAGISYEPDVTAYEFTQLLNVMFGNSSMKAGVRVERIELGEKLAPVFRGPRFGAAGIRELLKVPERPLACAILKPMGLDGKALAKTAYELALGGVDIIKEDHGITNQPSARFKDRVRYCVWAVEKAKEKTGKQALYLANVTAPYDEIFERAGYAKDNGVGGYLVAPGIVGFDIMRSLSCSDDLSLPVFAHPALLGSFTVNPDSGVSAYCLHGQLMRLAGADGSIFPHFGGRFSWTEEDCGSAAKGCRDTMNGVDAALPCVGGGVTLEKLKNLIQFYGRNVVFLLGTGAVSGPDVTGRAKKIMKAIHPVRDI
ncbi:MAG: hypothetical protein JW803_02605 [Endomicrobiales bacterium]|nr:hypothetical protein [Endomicrobiales bacterium]